MDALDQKKNLLINYFLYLFLNNFIFNVYKQNIYKYNNFYTVIHEYRNKL